MEVEEEENMIGTKFGFRRGEYDDDHKIRFVANDANVVDDPFLLCDERNGRLVLVCDC